MTTGGSPCINRRSEEPSLSCAEWPEAAGPHSEAAPGRAGPHLTALPLQRPADVRPTAAQLSSRSGASDPHGEDGWRIPKAENQPGEVLSLLSEEPPTARA